MNNEQRKIRITILVICSLVICCSEMPDPLPPPAAQKYKVTVMSDGAFSFSDGGLYLPGESVNIDAGTRDGYVFTGWTSASAGVYFVNAGNKYAAFIMPANAVIVTANWSWDAGNIVCGYGNLPFVNAIVKEGRRPIPLSAVNGKSYDDLLFRERTGSPYHVFNKNYQWRKDAWTRIGEIRKGNFTVIVKDASGNTVNGAAVNAVMYEHEFKWGTAINNNITITNTTGNRYSAAVSLLFNTCVLENHHKWNLYETDPARTRLIFDTAKNLGIGNMRGHTLIWDSRNYLNVYANDNSIPRRVYDWFREDYENEPKTAGNKDKIMDAIQAHIQRITGAHPVDGYGDQVYVWDAVNELLYNRSLRDLYGGWPVVKQWLDWAREYAGSNTLLFVNETNLITKNWSQFPLIREYLDDLLEINCDFDGIGIQSHIGSSTPAPHEFYEMMQGFDKYGKLLEITEFDMGAAISEDRQYEGSFVRDIMIAAFSKENVNAFLMWGFWSSPNQPNKPVFHEDWTLKESGIQYIDLVYNKWWTKENGITGEDGKYHLSGFFGDYDITVTANGKTKTVEAQFYKNQNNTITVVME